MAPSTTGLPVTDREADHRRWWALGVIALAQLMVLLDGTIVNIALPSAQQALGISTADRQWIVTAYTLTFGGLLLLGGRLTDLMGRKRAFLIGLVGFAAASALGGASGNAALLFAARGLQGAFAALLAPAALALLTVTFTDARERATAFGVYGAVSGGGAAIGLLGGGLLTEYASWRWCLFVNVPIALIACLAAAPLVRESGRKGNVRYDLPGAVLVTGGLFGLVYGLTTAASSGWRSAGTVALLVAAAVLLGAFAVWEGRAPHPLLPPGVVLDRNRGSSFVISVLIGAAVLSMFLFMTFYLQQTLGYSALRSGVAYLPYSAGIVTGAWVAARTVPRFGPRATMAAGGLATTAGMAWLTQLDLDSEYATDILPSFVAIAVGMSLLLVPLSNTSLTGVQDQDAGVASALVNTTQQVGSSIGTALLNAIFTAAVAGYLGVHGTGSGARAAAALHGYNQAFWVSTGLLAVATGVVLVFITSATPGRESVDVERPPAAP